MGKIYPHCWTDDGLHYTLLPEMRQALEEAQLV